MRGGVTSDVYPDFLQINRYINGEQKLFECDLKEVLSGKRTVKLNDGDVVTVKKISKPLEEYVNIDGSVYYPGQFDLKENNKLSVLLNNAKPTWQAKTSFIVLERTRPDQTVKVITLPFPKADGSNDFALQQLDKIHILNKSTYSDVDTISVNGQVRKPFSREFAIDDTLTINKAIEMAGGLKPSVYPVAYIFRKDLRNPDKMKYIPVNVNKDGKMHLKPGDALNVYDNSIYTNVGELRILGAIKKAGNFTYDPSMTIHDLIMNAGGFTVGAAYDNVTVFRTVFSPTEPTKLQSITLKIDSSYHVVNVNNFSLQPYDKVVVRMTPEFTLGRTVEISGMVKYPGVYVLENKQTTLTDVIKKAGGLLKEADPYGGALFRTYNNRGNISISLKDIMKNPGNYAYNPILFDGDIVNINRMENTVTIAETGTRMDQYISVSDNSMALGSKNATYKNVVYQGKHNARWYIRNFSGGFRKNADKNSVTVTSLSNQMTGTKRFLWIRHYPVVYPGSTIALKMNTERVKKEMEPKEKTDLQTTIGKTLTTLTSTLSVILLLREL